MLNASHKVNVAAPAFTKRKAEKISLYLKPDGRRAFHEVYYWNVKKVQEFMENRTEFWGKQNDFLN